MYKKEYKTYEVVRGTWFWQIESVTIQLFTRYKDWDCVITKYDIPEDILDNIRMSLQQRIKVEKDISKLVKKAKSLFVTFRTERCLLHSYHRTPHHINIPFYIVDDCVYFDFDKSYSRAKKLKEIGL
jgi:hypothetical protein